MASTSFATSNRIAVVLVAGLLAVCTARPSSAQTCTGDCKGLGRVDIADLITAVSISLGVLSLDACPALGPAPVTISRLITAVSNSLCACQACPTPRPTSTVTATPLETATPSATPTPTAIVSVWQEDDLQIPSSNCPQQLTQQLRQTLAGRTFVYTVEQRGSMVRLGDGMGSFVDATIDDGGTLETFSVTSEQQGSCVVTLETHGMVNLRQSPTMSITDAHFTTRSCPTMFDCTMQITSRWTRTSTLRAAATSVRNLLRAALFATP
jgi:hypothetical protein